MIHTNKTPSLPDIVNNVIKYQYSRIFGKPTPLEKGKKCPFVELSAYEKSEYTE